MSEQVQLIEIQAKTKTGHVQAFKVAEIISIDGRPYQSHSESEALKNHVIHLDGRLTAVERILSGNDGSET